MSEIAIFLYRDVIRCRLGKKNVCIECVYSIIINKEKQ